jgi:hypothetical protein
MWYRFSSPENKRAQKSSYPKQVAKMGFKKSMSFIILLLPPTNQCQVEAVIRAECII